MDFSLLRKAMETWFDVFISPETEIQGLYKSHPVNRRKGGIWFNLLRAVTPWQNWDLNKKWQTLQSELKWQISYNGLFIAWPYAKHKHSTICCPQHQWAPDGLFTVGVTSPHSSIGSKATARNMTPPLPPVSFGSTTVRLRRWLVLGTLFIPIPQHNSVLLP
jgi:hypothetical protein